MEYFRQRFIDELNDEGPVIVRGFDWPSADVLKQMSPNDYETHFTDWTVIQKQASVERAREFLQENGCLERFNRLHTQLEKQSVIPFVGAGLSKSTGFPMWGAFLAGLTSDYATISADVGHRLSAYRYEEAADLLISRLGTNVFSEGVQNTFGSQTKPIKGPVQLLPLLFKRGCITTNFDYVLDRVYDFSDCRLKDKFIGARLKEAPRRLADDPHCLLRIHGEADSENGRVLTSVEYDACYGAAGSYRELMKILIANSSLLFMGCSLSVDRTITALREIKQQAVVETPRHFAFLPLNDDVNREARRTELALADIHPIWYPPENPDQAIEDLLLALLEGGFHD